MSCTMSVEQRLEDRDDAPLLLTDFARFRNPKFRNACSVV